MILGTGLVRRCRAVADGYGAFGAVRSSVILSGVSLTL